MDFFLEIWQTISKNRSRSLLTAFGVFWGMLMLIVLQGGGNALTQSFMSDSKDVSSNSGHMWAQPTSVPYAGFQTGRRWEIEYADIEVIREKVSSLAAISPGLSAGTLTVSNGAHHQNYSVEGITPDVRLTEAITVQYGRDISAIDLQEQRKVCVIGSQVRKVIFPDNENPVGRYILCGSMYLQVVGVLKEVTSEWTKSVNEQVQMPLTTLQRMQHKGNGIDYMTIVSKPDVPAAQTIEQVAAVLKQRHQISPEDKKAVGSFDMSSIFKIVNAIAMGIYALIWIIGLGTLISGAVGVSNIMLVTVRERTKEIGVRRAIGASPWLIARQIMAESIVLTSMAGVIGIMAGVGILAVAEKVLVLKQVEIQNIQVSFTIAIVCLIIIIMVGALAGLMPALRALKVKPIEALNEE